ncbi:MAG: hypothetical protein EOO41_04075, partial [Methanobacteriota archaeon]
MYVPATLLAAAHSCVPAWHAMIRTSSRVPTPPVPLNAGKTRAQVAEARAAEREQVVEQLAGALESSTSAAEALHHQLSQAEEAIQVLGDELTVRDRELATYASVTQEAQREAQRAVAYYDVTAAPGHPRTAPPALSVQQHAGTHSLAGVTQPVV